MYVTFKEHGSPKLGKTPQKSKHCEFITHVKNLKYRLQYMYLLKD